MISIKKMLTKILVYLKTHTHSASDITSGTLGVSNGGTGLTSSPSMLTNLGSTTAASVFAASPRPGVTGTLPIENGGSGETQVRATTQIDNVISAASGFSITAVQFSWWGKVATVRAVIKKNSTAVSSGVHQMATLKAGYRPRYNTVGFLGWDEHALIEYSDGAISAKRAFTANEEVTVYATYVLGNTSM